MMPKLGEIKRAREIGLKGYTKYIRHACLDCGKERWLQFIKGKAVSKRCRFCEGKRRVGTKGFQTMGDKHPNWKGGRTTDPAGYVRVKLYYGDFFYPMATRSGYVLEHRLVMARSLGRCLQAWEKVHHKGTKYTDNENRGDNRKENLELTTQGSHIREHQRGYRDGYQKGLTDGRLGQIKELKTQNDELLKQIKLCQWQIKELGAKVYGSY